MGASGRGRSWAVVAAIAGSWLSVAVGQGTQQPAAVPVRRPRDRVCLSGRRGACQRPHDPERSPRTLQECHSRASACSPTAASSVRLNARRSSARGMPARTSSNTCCVPCPCCPTGGASPVPSGPRASPTPKPSTWMWCTSRRRSPTGRALRARPAASRRSACSKTTCGRRSRYFAAENIPLEIIVAVDVSGSMTDAMGQVKAAVKTFLSALRPH